MTGAETPYISVVVVNWNTADLLDACLGSLDQHMPTGSSVETIVFDNGSVDHSADLVRAKWPSVTLIQSGTNLGYARASNQAIRASRGSLLLLINADALLTPGCLEPLVERMEKDPRAAVAAPRLVYADGSWQRWTAGREPTLTSTASFLLGLERASANWATRSVYLARDQAEASSVDWVSSACMVVRRETLDQVGLLDERYFCYMDDVDLCRRVREAGWTVWYHPEVSAVHVMGQSSFRQTGAASPAALRNFNDYFTRRNGMLAGLALRGMELIGFGGRALIYLLMSPRQPSARSQAKAHLRNLRMSLKGGFV